MGEFTDSGQVLDNYYSADVSLGDVDDDGDVDPHSNSFNSLQIRTQTLAGQDIEEVRELLAA